MKDIAASISFVTHKEVMIFWNIPKRTAVNRLNIIRKSLGKKKFHKLSVVQFCKAEDITIDEFQISMQQHFNPQKRTA